MKMSPILVTSFFVFRADIVYNFYSIMCSNRDKPHWPILCQNTLTINKPKVMIIFQLLNFFLSFFKIIIIVIVLL